MPPDDFEFLPGDLAACFGRDWTGRCIGLATASPLAPAGLRWGPSHIAIVCTQHRQRLWVESTTLAPRPCLVRGEQVSGVQAHVPAERIADYVAEAGRVELYRLVEIERLSPTESRLLTKMLLGHFVARALPYDLPGAILSGTRVMQLTKLFPGGDLQRLFCSELAAAALMRLGRLGRANPTRFHPARLLRTLVRNGTYRRVAAWGGRS